MRALRILRIFSGAFERRPHAMQVLNMSSPSVFSRCVMPATVLFCGGMVYAALDIQALIDDAIRSGAPTLVIPPGIYPLDAPAGGSALMIRGAKRLTIEAADASFIMVNPAAGLLQIRDSEELTLQGFSVDYDPLPFTIGRILEVRPAEAAILIEPLPGYPPPDHPMFAQPEQWGYFLDPSVPGKLADGTPNVLFREEMKAVGDGGFLVRFVNGAANQLRHVSAGMLTAQLARSAQLIHAADSRHLVFRDITAYASPASHFLGANLEGIRIENCRAVIRAGRHKSGNADGVHMQNVRGPIIIRGCEFEGISDDAVNIYQKPHFLLPGGAPDSWRLSTRADRFARRPTYGALRAGDVLHAYDAVTGRDCGRAELLQIDEKTGGAKIGGGWKLPEDPAARAGVMVFSDAFGADTLVENNTFARLRRYGLYLKCHRSRVSGNTFESLSSSAIFASNDVRHEEGGFCGDLLIEGNTIRNCGFERLYLDDPKLGAITINAENQHFTPITATSLHCGIVIRGNTIINTARGFVISNTDGLEIHGNLQSPAAGAVPLTITHSARVHAE